MQMRLSNKYVYNNSKVRLITSVYGGMKTVAAEDTSG